MAAALLVLTGCEADPQAGEPPATPPGDATPAPPSAEDHLVALGADGRVVVLDAATGEEVRELLAGVPVHDPAANDVAVGPRHESVFVAVPPVEGETGHTEIVRVPFDGGDEEVVARGTAPAVSPDGGALAYVDYVVHEEPARSPEPVLVLRDLVSGDERRLTREQPFHFVPEVVWTAHGSHVAFTAGEIGTGLYVVDREAASLDAARRLGPDLEGDQDGMSWGPAAAFGDGRLAVVETCCDVPQRQRWQVVSVDVSGGRSDALLPGDRLEATALDSDSASERLLVVASGGPDGGQLLRWDGEGAPEDVTGGVIVAAW